MPFTPIQVPQSDGVITPVGHDASPSDPLSEGAKIGIGVSVGVVGAGAGLFVLLFMLKKKRDQKKKQKDDKTPMYQVDTNSTYGKMPANKGKYGNFTSSDGKYSNMSTEVTSDDGIAAPTAIQPSEIDKRMHIPYKSLVFVKEIGAGSYGKVYLG